MALNYGNRNLTAGSNSPYIPLVADNPAFKVAIIPVDGRFEEKPNAADGRAEQEAIKVGETIRGEVLSKSKTAGEKVLGRVLMVEETEGNITAYKILDQDGKTRMVDPTTAVVVSANTTDVGIDTNAVTEHRVMLFEEWTWQTRK